MERRRRLTFYFYLDPSSFSFSPSKSRLVCARLIDPVGYPLVFFPVIDEKEINTNNVNDKTNHCVSLVKKKK